MVQRRSQKRRSQRGGLESAKEVHSVVSDIKLMFSSDRALANKYQKDPKAFARAVARKHNIRMKTALAASTVAAASAMVYGVVQHKKAKKMERSLGAERKHRKDLQGVRAASAYGDKAEQARRKKVRKKGVNKAFGKFMKGKHKRQSKGVRSDIKGFQKSSLKKVTRPKNYGGKRGSKRRSSKRRSSKRRR